MEDIRRVRAIINPKSGVFWTSGLMQRALEKHWNIDGIDLTYQFSRSAQDGREKARRAIGDGVDTVLVVGGDGMVNTIGGELVGTEVALGVIPAGSGNGFARHFGIPLEPDKAARELVKARRERIDVGTANGRPFFVTCSMAWDAQLVKSYEQSPVRGVLPYVFAGVYEFFDYIPQPMEVTLDEHDTIRFDDPLVFTVANLTQFGGGAVIAPNASPDDGEMELVVIPREHVAWILANMNRVFDGTIDQIKQVVTRRFKSLYVHREKKAPIQVDGELVESPRHVAIQTLERALTVLVPVSS